MHRSFSETKFLCYKACVGAGIDVGRAEDIASSAVRIGAYQSEIFDFLPNLCFVELHSHHLEHKKKQKGLIKMLSIF